MNLRITITEIPMFNWYYIVDKDGKPSLEWLNDNSFKNNLNNWTDGLKFVQKIEHPLLSDPFTVQIGGLIIFKMENPAIIPLIVENQMTK